MARALRSLKGLSNDYLRAGMKHDNPEFLWIGKGMSYAIDHIKDSMRKDLLNEEE